ncbi:hypothetical protein J2Z76_001587 [Sedimentibacter acidaminivorans]|uniref:SLH domain-containing protein n=1 Tax=Sedimentibacter acidaminivorans TaxID=913099 RepID=A0ABS4GDF7_9FIRM|nr:S-layer homology domain-containing protein [Sedimentibacter acidaminivorans]MBP1925726.1 hypothetical protein [Sedimentibacter acidaminivorans]
MIKKSIIILLIFTIIFSYSNTIYGSETVVRSISINGGKTLNMAVDDFVTLDIKINPTSISSNSIKFSSSKPTIADVDYKGNVTAKKVGRTTITAELNGKKSSITVRVSSVNKSISADFSTKDVSSRNFKEITITPHRYDDGELIEDDADDEYYIYLPSGYLVNGKSASYVADRNGVYPFTIYYGNTRRTLYYTVKDIDSNVTDNNNIDDDEEDINFDYTLMYDYEKKQILFNMELDKIRSITAPNKKTTISSSVNYYITNIKNNNPIDFSFTIDDVIYRYKVIRQGEFYLLISLLPVDYDDYSSIVHYSGYNFTTNEIFETFPNKGIFYDNGNYEVMIQSDSNTKEIFNFNIDGIDFRRPSVESSFLSDYTFELEIEDDFGLDYMITFDGKYVPLGGNSNTGTKIVYKHNTKVTYNGDYVFTVVDKSGNRTAYITNIDSRIKSRKHSIDYGVHNYKYTKDLFENIGILYKNNDDNSDLYEIILPSYMNGSNSSYFYPDSNISRAEIVTLFCRITDLPYDTNAFLKNKFTDIEHHWARDYISMGSSKRYVSGYKDKTFRPDNNVTRAEFCKMLSNISAFKSKVSALPATSNYDYIDINSHWAQKEIIKITSRDIVVGNNSHFYPDKPITRAEVVHAINKLYNLNPTASELAYINSIYKKYYNYRDIINNKYYDDIIISIVGMYREKLN